MRNEDIHKVISTLRETILQWQEPVVGVVAKTRDPFRVLVATVLSLRTKDDVTSTASKKLFDKADNPAAMLKLDESEIAELIYPVLYYNNKAKSIRDICQTLINEYDGKVPDDLDELLKLKGVGRKTANLVVTLGFNKPGICVDIHVHRISNRLGYIKTKTPDESEMALRKKLPEEYWMIYNDLLVPYGQNLCRPVSPFCSKCPIFVYCDRKDVKHSR